MPVRRIKIDHPTEVNEGTTSYAEIAFKDKDRDLAAPNSYTYRLDDVTDGTGDDDITNITADTTVSGPTSEEEIEFDATENKILDDDNEEELRRVTITADYGSDDEATANFYFRVTNLTKI